MKKEGQSLYPVAELGLKLRVGRQKIIWPHNTNYQLTIEI
jgi:hypothetical protein